MLHISPLMNTGFLSHPKNVSLSRYPSILCECSLYDFYLSFFSHLVLNNFWHELLALITISGAGLNVSREVVSCVSERRPPHVKVPDNPSQLPLSLMDLVQGSELLILDGDGGHIMNRICHVSDIVSGGEVTAI